MWLIRGALRRPVTAVVCDSEATRADAATLAGCDRERLHVVPLGIGPPFRLLAPAERAAARGIKAWSPLAPR